MSTKSRNFIIAWLPFALVISVACAAAYGVGQQVLRQSANDPQVGLAEDAANRLMQGADPAKLVGQAVDVAQTAAPAVQIYDENNKLIASSMTTGSTIPKGVLNYARANGKDELTWQTAAGTRLAAVAVATSDHGDVVVAARSLKEYEGRNDHLMNMIAAGWLLALAGSLGLQWLLRKSA